MNNVLTASRMVCALQCLRKHYWAFEVGLQRKQSGLAQRIGSAWARALEARAKGASYEDALAAAIPEGIDLDNYTLAIIAALLAGYFRYYQKDTIAKMHPEEEFHFELGFGDFTAGGKLDGLGTKKNRSSFILESKTTNDSIAPDAQYWMRLKFNMQILQYTDAAIRNGWEIQEVIYDVTRKPQIRPKEVKEIDKDQIPIVRDMQGNRVIKKNGEPKATADKAKGEFVNSHVETPEEFSDRLLKDTIERPEFYFARREVPITETDLEQFRAQRFSIAHMILSARARQAECDPPEAAWPRNVLESTCTYCQYKSFCLQNHEIDLNNPPEGFSIEAFNPELTHEPTTTAQDDSTAD
jgi:PD-(D/E)XK nuclease superfamily